jgi:hypothetical protein
MLEVEDDKEGGSSESASDVVSDMGSDMGSCMGSEAMTGAALPVALVFVFC